MYMSFEGRGGRKSLLSRLPSAEARRAY